MENSSELQNMQLLAMPNYFLQISQNDVTKHWPTSVTVIWTEKGTMRFLRNFKGPLFKNTHNTGIAQAAKKSSYIVTKVVKSRLKECFG